MHLPKQLFTPPASVTDPFDGHGDPAAAPLYWPTACWQVLLSSGSSRSIEPLPLPFVLIGSHPLCGIRITDRHVPPVAYFACAFDDSIEAWPLCPIAFAQWGVVSSQHAILVGKHRIRLMHETHPRWQQVSSNAANNEDLYSCFNDPSNELSLFRSPSAAKPKLDLELEWDGTRRIQSLARRVLILGADHPSTLRLRGLGLATCDHAIVAVGDTIWTIRLDLTTSDRNLDSLVTRVPIGDAPLTIQRLRISVIGNESLHCESLYETNSLTSNPCTGGLLNLGDDSEADAKIFLGNSRDEFSDVATSPPPQHTSPDALTAGVTERLIQLARNKVSHQKMLVFTAILMITMGLLALIIRQMLWPLVAKLTS